MTELFHGIWPYRHRGFMLFAAVVSLALGGVRPAMAEPVLQISYGEVGFGTEVFLTGLEKAWRWDRKVADYRLASVRTDDIRSRLRGLSRGEVEFSIIPARSAKQALEGHPNLRVLGLLWPNYLHALVRGAGTPVLTLPVPKPVLVVQSAGFVLEGLREWGRGKGRRLGSIQPARAGTDPIALAKEGRGIVLFSAPAPLAEVRQALVETPDLRVIRVSGRLSEVLRLYYPWIQQLAFPADAYPGLRPGTTVPSWRMVMVTREDTPRPAVRKMLDSLYGRNTVLEKGNPLFAGLDGKVNKTFARLMPFHEETGRRFGFAAKKN